MYFIKSGFVEVLATDEKTVIAYLGEGCYFGEIGVLITGTRSVTARSKNITVCYTIDKDSLHRILNSYPA